MNRFAELLDRLAYEPGRNAKLRLIADYLRATPDPERGWALAALTGALTFGTPSRGMIRALITERTDPVLFGLSYDYVGDLSETVALMWPADADQRPNATPSLTDVVETLSTLGKAQLPAQLARWLDALDETGRWALLKLVTGGLRIGVSARLAKTAAAALGGKDAGRSRDALARARAALCASCSPGWKGAPTSRRAATRRRSGRRCWRMRSRRPILPRSIPPTSWRNGNGTASACRRSCGSDAHGAAGRAALFAHRRGHLQKLSRSHRSAAPAGGHRRRAADLARRRACSRSTCCSSGSTAKPSRPSCWRNSRRICAPTISWPKATKTCAPCPSPSAARGWKPSSPSSTIRASTFRRWSPSRPGTS